MKNILVVLMIALTAQTLFASKARVEALGEDSFGSVWIQDDRNIYLNAAYIHRYYDFVQVDMGNTNQGYDEEGSPKASGTYVKNAGKYIWGIGFGQESNTVSQLRALAMQNVYGAAVTGGPFAYSGTLAAANTNVSTAVGTNATALDESNVLDLMFGGGTNTKWAAKLRMTQFMNEQGNTFTDAGSFTHDEKEVTMNSAQLSLGMLTSNGLEGYANINLANRLEFKANNSANDFAIQGKMGIQLGAVKRYNEGVSAFAEVRTIGMAIEDLDARDKEFSTLLVKLGAGQEKKVNDKFTAFYSARVQQQTYTNKNFQDNSDEKTLNLWGTVGFEVRAKEWLTLRGSVSNSLINEIENDAGKKKTVADTLRARMGASLHFGEFTIDGLIAMDNDGDGIVENGGLGQQNVFSGSNGALRTDSLLSRVSMTYKF